jgi:hypothetical protein
LGNKPLKEWWIDARVNPRTQDLIGRKLKAKFASVLIITHSEKKMLKGAGYSNG